MSYISSTSKEKHARPRLCAGAKMFGEALRQIRTSRNVKPSASSSIRSNDGSLENKASLNLPDNLEIIEVTSDSLDQQKAANRKVTYGAQSKNRLHPKHSIAPNESLDSDPKSKDRLYQTFDTEYPSSNKEIELQVSRLNELSLIDKNYHCENDSNLTFETQIKSEEENRQATYFKSYQTKQSFGKDKNNNDGGRSIFWEKESNTGNSNSIYNEEQNNDKIDFFRENVNNSNKSISMFRENESHKDIFSSDEDCSSQIHCSNAYECNKIFKDSSSVSKQHTLSLNELCTRKEHKEPSKPGVKHVSVNKSKYFVPQNFLGKIYDFPVHHSKDTSHLLSTQNVSKNSLIKNSSLSTILPKHFYKSNVKQGNSGLSNNHKCFAGKAPATNQIFNYRKEIEFEELSDETLGKKCDSVSSKGHHVLLSEIFGPPQNFDNSFLEKPVDSFQDNLKCKQDIVQKDIVTVNNKYCNALSDELLSNNCKKEKVSVPQKTDFCSSYSVPLCLRNPSKYHSFEKYTVDSTKGSVQHFENDASHKINPMTLKSYSSPLNEIIYPESQSSKTAVTISKSSLGQLKSSSLECLEQKYTNTNHSNDVHQISNSEIDCDKNMYKQTQPLSKCDTYYSCATKCAPLYVSHSLTDKQVPLSSVRNESACIFNLKDKDMKISKDFDSSTASHSLSPKYVSLSSDCRVRNKEAVGTEQIFSSTHSSLSECSEEPRYCDTYYSSAAKYMPLSSNYAMNKEYAGAFNSKQMTAQVENSSHSFLDKNPSLSSVMNECAFNSKHRAMKVHEDSDSSTSSRSLSQKYVPLSSVMNECAKQSANKVNSDSDSSTSSRSSSHKYVPFSSHCLMMNKKVAGTKQITVKNASSQPLLFSGFGEELQHLSDVASDSSSSGHDLQICHNSFRKLTTDTISFQEYMKQEDFAIKCNTDFIVPSKFSYDSNGDLPLSSSVLEVVPDLLIGTCLVDPSD